MASLESLRTLVRERLDDEVAPYLWSDPYINAALNEAVDEACERARLILDSTSGMTQIAITPDAARYSLNPLILSVERVHWQGHRLKHLAPDRLPDGWQELRGVRPEGYVLEDGLNMLPVPLPNVATTLQLTVFRRPLEPMTANADEPEIHSQYHLRLIDWALRCCYLKRDTDTYDEDLAARHESFFERSFGSRPSAEVHRSRHAGRPKTVRMNPGW